MNKSPVLPRYSKDVDSQPETSALLKHSRSVSDLESQIPNIPADEGGAKVEVTLTFVPRWPVVGEEQHALGMLGWTRHETAITAQRCFAALAEYPTDRIEFLIPLEQISGVEQRWGVVMDEAWARFRQSPPKGLKVQIKDAPGDAAGRVSYLAREAQWRVITQDHLPVVFWIVFAVCIVGGFLTLLKHLFG